MSSRQVELYVRQAGHPERRFLVSTGSTQIGRAEDNEVVLSDLGVSRRHARVSLVNDELVIEDLGSGNGTWYRGQEIQKQVITDGDEVEIDPFVLIFRFQEMSPKVPEEAEDHTLKAHVPGPEKETQARLVVLAGHRLASVYPIPKSGLSMGRSESRDVVLFDPGASRNHLRIELRVGGFWLVDLGSANGTHLNGKRVKEHLLVAGDRIRIGSTEFRMEIQGDAARFSHQSAKATLPDAMEVNEPSSAASVALPHGASGTRTNAVAGLPMAPADPPLTAPSAASVGPSRMEWLMAVGVLVGLVVVVTVGIQLLDYMEPRDEIDTIQPSSQKGKADNKNTEKGPPYDYPSGQVEWSALPVMVQDKMAQGQIRLHEGDYYQASSDFIDARKAGKQEGTEGSGLDPSTSFSSWMMRTSYEHIAFDVLWTDLLVQNHGKKAKKSIRNQALRDAKKAIENGEGQAEARRNLIQAQTLAGAQQDPQIQVLKDKLDQELIAAMGQDENRSLRLQLEALVNLGNEAIAEQRYRDALGHFDEVIDSDPESRTHSRYDAEDGKRVAEMRLSRLLRMQWDRLADAYRDQDMTAARQALETILWADPLNEAAQEKLNQLAD